MAERIYQTRLNRTVYVGRGSASKVKAMARKGRMFDDIVSPMRYVAQRGQGMFYDRKKGKAVGRKYWTLGLERR